MAEISKAERRVLREMAGKAHEAEAHRMLEKLDARFQRWRDGKIPSSELIEDIHQFHQQESRDLWSLYRSLKEQQAVERGVALGLIAETDVPPALLVKLAAGIEFFREHHVRSEEADQQEDA